MNKRFLCGIAAAGLILSGCSAGQDSGPVPTFGGCRETEPAVVQAATEPADGKLVYGQIVWNVIRSEDGADAYLIRSMVFAQDGDLVSVIPMFSQDPDEVRDVLNEVARMPKGEEGYLDLVTADNCYLDRESAQAEADRINGEGLR